MANVVVWFDVPTNDFDRAVKFYSDILGAPVRVQEYEGQKLGFFPMEGEGSGGDIVPPGVGGNKPSTEGTRIYLNCEGKLDEVLGRVEKAGGQIVQHPFQIPDGKIAVISDTEGNNVGLHSST
jgi:predicted enzyme related to lactoylglutathione lyase